MSPPNIIMVLCDQLRAFDVGCYGNSVIRTPHIDQLARDGVRFQTSVTNNPVCTPARSILLSGQYNRTCTGSLANDADTPPSSERTRLCDPTLPEAFHDAGYHTGLVGKWHMHPHPLTVGFDEAFFPRHNHRYTGQTYLRDWSDEFPVAGYTPDIEIGEVARFVSAQRDQPFFLYYNISQPHMPLCDAPARYREMYDHNTVPLRENVWQAGEMAYDENWFKIYCWDFLYYMQHLLHTETLPPGFDLRNLIALYYGLTTWADDQVGALLRILREQGVAEDTLVVFTSDHGDNLGSHHLFNKDHLIEEGLRIPLIFHWPASITPHTNTAQVASLVDLMPTVLSLAGLPCPATAQGTDLAPVVRGELETCGENLAFIETSAGEIGVRTPRYLYGMRMDGAWQDRRPVRIAEERYTLTDLQYDPFELRNCIDDPVYQEIALLLRERLRHWDSETPWLTI